MSLGEALLAQLLVCFRKSSHFLQELASKDEKEQENQEAIEYKKDYFLKDLGQLIFESGT